MKHCIKYITSNAIQFGYIIPGHGEKGKQITIDSPEELQDMYRAYQGRNEIVLWIKNEQPQRKRGSTCTIKSPEDVPVTAKVSKSRYDDHVKETCELDEIVEKLQAKHGSKYMPEQLLT